MAEGNTTTGHREQEKGCAGQSSLLISKSTIGNFKRESIAGGSPLPPSGGFLVTTFDPPTNIPAR